MNKDLSTTLAFEALYTALVQVSLLSAKLQRLTKIETWVTTVQVSFRRARPRVESLVYCPRHADDHSIL